jgi:hypothetical protein
MSNQQNIVSATIRNSAVAFDSMTIKNHLVNTVMPSIGVKA